MLAFQHPLDDLIATVPFFRHGPPFHSTTVGAAHREQLHESESEYTLTLALPGMRPNDLKLTFQEGVLSIEGVTKTAHECLTASHQLRLPSDVDIEAAAVAAENGMLSVTLPRRAPSTHQLVVTDSNDALPVAAEGDYIITVAVPGIRPSELKLTREDRVLRVDGESKAGRHFHRISERKRLPFDADFEAATAVAENGILTIHVPKKARAAPRELWIGARVEAGAAEMEMVDAPAAGVGSNA